MMEPAEMHAQTCEALAQPTSCARSWEEGDWIREEDEEEEEKEDTNTWGMNTRTFAPVGSKIGQSAAGTQCNLRPEPAT